MGTDATKIIIETMVRKAIKDIKDSPRRSVRNIIDMALNFSDGRFQKHFFLSAQRMLRNEKSAYYDLALDTVNNVDADRIVTFGMNVGYNGCTLGARRIREMEDAERYNIPWSVTLLMDERCYSEHQEVYSAVVEQGKALGIHVWQLYMKDDPSSLLPLLEVHTDCAFALLCEPQSVTDDFLDEISRLNHVMPVIRCSGDTAEVCRRLRERHQLYGVYYAYKASDEEMLMSGDLFYSMEQLHPVFTMLAAASECPIAVRERIYDSIVTLRNEQSVQTIPWELTYDANLIDGIISSEPCTALFDMDGNFHTWYSQEKATAYNLFREDLVSIFRQALPKAGDRL